MDEDKYPHWKDALFGNHNAVANLRCAVHYVFWHAVYALIAVIGVVVVGAIKAGKAIAPYLGPVGEPLVAGLDAIFGKVSYVMNHRYTKKLGDAVLLIFAVGVIVGAVGGLAFLLYTEFWATLTLIGGVLLGCVALFGLLILAEYLHDPAKNAASGAAMKMNAAGEKAVQTPGIRRVYGECPVSMDMAPKWFDDLFPEEDNL